MDAGSVVMAEQEEEEQEEDEEDEEEEKLQSSAPTSLHQPPVGRRAADEEEDGEEQQGQADAHDGAGRRPGGLRLRVLAWGQDGCHRVSPLSPGWKPEQPPPSWGGCREPQKVLHPNTVTYT